MQDMDIMLPLVHPNPGSRLVYDAENLNGARWLSLEDSCRSASFRGLVQDVSRPLSSLTSRRRTISPPDPSRICVGTIRKCVRVFLGRVYLFPRIESLKLPPRLVDS